MLNNKGAILTGTALLIFAFFGAIFYIVPKAVDRSNTLSEVEKTVTKEEMKDYEKKAKEAEAEALKKYREMLR